MKKSVKIISTVLMVIMLLTTISSIAIAGTDWDPTSTINKMNQSSGVTHNQVDKAGQVIITIIRVVGVIVAIVMLLVLGIKYMTGSAEQRAEYKKTMIPYVVGAVLLFAATTIVGLLYDFIKNLNT